MNKTASGRMTRAVGAALVSGAVIVGTSIAAAGTAEAHGACYSWAHSTSPFTGGFTALCNQDSDRVSWRVVGLCKSRVTASGRWVDGPWVSDGVSFVGCSWSEVPVPDGFVQLR